MPDTRINPTTVANAETTAKNSTMQESPTGTPILPPAWTPWLSVVVAIAGVVSFIPGVPPAVITICGLIVAVGAALGIASPGSRKHTQ